MLAALKYALVIAALTFAIAFIGISVWRSYQIHHVNNQRSGKGSKDEGQGVSPTETPDAAIARYNFWLVVFTGVLALVALIQINFLITADRSATRSAKAAEDAANAAIESNKINRAAMIADQRPWISLEVSLGGPLAYDDSGWDAGLRWHVPLIYRLQNIGKTPAVNVDVFGEIILYTSGHFAAFKNGIPQGLPIPGTDIMKEFDGVCGFPEKMNDVKMGFGRVMFPNEPPIPQTFGMNGNPRIFEDAKTNPGYTGQFLVVMCASYGSTLDSTKYRTAKAFQLFKSGRQDRSGRRNCCPWATYFVMTPQNGSYAK